MSLIARGLLGAVALLHLYFLYLEMFLWAKPTGLRIFGQSLEQAMSSKTLAANQGLYNGFLAAGLLWSAGTENEANAIFFLACVIVAGLYGASTVSRKILFVQAIPAVAALVALLFS